MKSSLSQRGGGIGGSAPVTRAFQRPVHAVVSLPSYSPTQTPLRKLSKEEGVPEASTGDVDRDPEHLKVAL